jgi:hypothetical protein
MEENKSINSPDDEHSDMTSSGGVEKPPNNEQPLSTPSTDETIVPASETSDINNPTSDIKDMEVHHHAHDPAAPHHKKNWKSYFWEFLMLFLAVFCGFLAEYQLEHKIERDRVKEYMKSMVSDLNADTTVITSSLAYAKETVQLLHTFENDLYSDSAFNNTQALYKQYAVYFRLVIPMLNDQTITQLRNAGNLRLVKNKKITDKLSEYWNGINALNKIADRVEQRYDVSAELGARIFNRKFIQQQLDTGILVLRGSLRNVTILPDAVLMTTDKNELATLANIVNRIKYSIEGPYIVRLNLQFKMAVDLIALIKEEYHIK